MRKITKSNEPASLTRWKRSNASGVYEDLTEIERRDIRAVCVQEQFYLCAYCCKPISGQNSDTMNEHVQARHHAQHLSLDFNNIVASCTTAKQCDESHGSQLFSLTPLMDECETELEFMISGRVRGNTFRAQEAIRVLNLGEDETKNRKLIEIRKQAIATILFSNGIDPDEGLEDDELLHDLINVLSLPKDNQLEPYSPIVINVLRGWLSE